MNYAFFTLKNIKILFLKYNISKLVLLMVKMIECVNDFRSDRNFGEPVMGGFHASLYIEKLLSPLPVVYRTKGNCTNGPWLH